MNNKDQIHSVEQQDEITLTNILLNARSRLSFSKELRNTLILCVIFGSLLGLGYSFYKKPTYEAELSFILEGDSKSGLGGYANIAAQFGMNIGGTGSVFQETDNIIAIIKSRNMVAQTLLSQGEFEGKKQLLIDRHLEYNNILDGWKNKPHLANISFDKANITRRQDSLLNYFHKQLLEQNLEVEKPDKKLDIIHLRYSGKDELFAKAFVEQLLQNVKEFYTEVQTKKASENVTILKRHTDSVRILLNSAISGVALSTDANPNPNPAFQRLRVSSQKKMVDVEMNRAILTELIKNLELAEISLRKETPLFQVIDNPVLPLEKHKLGKIKGAVIGAILGLVVGLGTIIAKRYFVVVQR